MEKNLLLEYLLTIYLNDNDIGDFKTFLKFAPPLRSGNDRKSLITAINSDLIDVIVLLINLRMRKVNASCSGSLWLYWG